MFLQAFDGRGKVDLRIAHHPLAVFRQIGEHREQAEPAHEGKGIVEAQLLQPKIRRRLAAMPLDAGRANTFGVFEQILAAMFADDIAQQLAEIADIGVLLDRRTLPVRSGGLV